MKVSDVMKKDIVAVKRNTTLRAFLAMFKDFHSLPLIPVTDKNNALIGVVHAENLLDILRSQQSRLFRNVPFVEIDRDAFDLDPAPSMGELIIIDDIMDTRFVGISEEQPLEEAYKEMHLHKVERLPVVDARGKLLGIIGIFDIVLRMFKEKGIV